MAMKVQQIVFKLDEGPVDSVLYCGDRVDARLLAEGKKTVVATVTRMGTWKHDQYGRFSITRKMLNEFVRNFENRTYGQDIFLDKDHNHTDGAAAEFKRLFVEGNKLRAELAFTPFGIKLATERGYRYLSAEFVEEYEDKETGEKHGALLMGAAFTIRPFVKGLDPVQLSENSESSHLIFLDQKVIRLLSEEIQIMKDRFLKILLAALAGFKLAEPVQKQLSDLYAKQADHLGDNEQAHQALVDQLTAAGKQLSEEIGDKVVKLDINLAEQKNAGKQLSAEDVSSLIAKELAEAKAAENQKLADAEAALSAKVKVLTDTVDAAEGLSDEVKAELKKELGEFITVDLPNDKIKSLAELQISKANEVAARAQLLALGMESPGHIGSAQIRIDTTNEIKRLQEAADKRLGITDQSDSKRFEKTGGQLLRENEEFAQKVLAQFDRERGRQLHEEAKMLAGGDSVLPDMAVPVSFERTVIREALYQLVGLQFVEADVEPFNTSTAIPYSYRDTSAAGRRQTRTYEGQGIRRAGMIQTSELAYPLPQKLALRISDELRYLSVAGHINYNVLQSNLANATRIVGEDTEQLIFDEHVRAADEYGAVPVPAEALTTQVNGTNNVFVLANFPVVLPRASYTLQGSLIGSVSNPITVTLGGAGIDEWDGTGEQAPGNYYVIDFNMGEVRIVDETGGLQTPANATALTVAYSRATNRVLFDTDLPANTPAKTHWDSFLTLFGGRKVEIEERRFYTANLGLMSGTAMNQIEQAEGFKGLFQVPGTDLNTNGNLGRIKQVPSFKSTAPGLIMGDNRVLVGERYKTRFRLMKAWAMSELENCRNSNGDFTGEKEAYGDQFIVLHTPSQLKRAMTSIVLYSASGRVARQEPAA